MNLGMKPIEKDALVRLLCSCGGTTGAMQNLARLVQRSGSNDLGEILGELVSVPGPIQEITTTCEEVSGEISLTGLIRHFSSFRHTTKMTNLKVTVAHELPPEQIPLAHTLLPLTILDGKYYYDCGEAYVEIRGLVQIGPSVGSPYAHLAALLWFRDEGLHVQVLAEQARSGVAASAKGIGRISYFETPKLHAGTVAGTAELHY